MSGSEVERPVSGAPTVPTAQRTSSIYPQGLVTTYLSSKNLDLPYRRQIGRDEPL